MARYTFVTDPGHGWVSVPLEDIKRLGITDNISAYSYMTDKRVYLEEDCDAGLFLDAAGIDLDSLPCTYSDNSKCRSYASYDPRWIHEPFGIGRKVWVQTNNGGQSKATIAGLQRGCYIAEGEEWIRKLQEIITFKYGIPASNPLKYCTPA